MSTNMSNKNEIEISVIMGVYNQNNRDELQEAVNSVINQSFEKFEFIIYDDGSKKELKEWIYELNKLDKRIRVTGSEQNNGLAFSLNSCIEISRGKYIARMDADDKCHPDRLKEQYDFMETHPEYSWCGCNAYLIDGDKVWGRRDMTEKPGKKDYLRFSPYIHPTVMYRREIFENEERYRVSKETLRCEDYELFMRLRNLGYMGYNIQKPLFYYRENRDSYKRRLMKYRVNETKIRYRNFKAMKLLLPFGWLYVIRPIIGGLIPAKLIELLKRRESAHYDRSTKNI